jgi:hypothetical protein
MRARTSTHFILGLALLAAPAAARAQDVRLVGRGDVETDERIRRFLAAGYTLIPRDTLLARNDTLPGPVLAAGVTVRLEGVIRGDLMIVDANVFVRPPARILGNVTNVAGAFVPSELATITGEVVNLPNAAYDVEWTPQQIRIIGTARRSLLVLDGLRGLRIPSYDRVNGLTLGLGAGYFLPRVGPLEPLLRGRLAYHARRRTFSGGAELALIREPTTLRLGAERATLTNDEWIRSTPFNTLAFLVQGKDYRNYYEADRAYAAVEHVAGDDLTRLSLSLGGQIEDARSLDAGDPWTLLGPDTVRPNPAVAEDRIASLLLGAGLDVERPTFAATVSGLIEVAGETAGGDHAFGRFQVGAEWAMAALANHTLVLEGQFRGPLPGTDSLPRQRWTFVGGSGTLYTFEVAEFPGDRVAFVETEYIIPFPETFRVPVIGTPSLELLHHAGMAWSHGVDRDFEQNIGLRLRFPRVWARVVTNPRAARDDVEFAVGVSLPRSYSWGSPDR